MPGFNVQKFMSEKFVPCTEIVPVPDLAEWFDEDEKPEFLVRNLTGNEFISVKYESLKKILKARQELAKSIDSEIPKDQMEAFKLLFKINKDSLHDEYIKLLEVMVRGCVSPVVDITFAAQFAKTQPTEFTMITSKILHLTDGGATKEKPKPSGTATQQ